MVVGKHPNTGKPKSGFKPQKCEPDKLTDVHHVDFRNNIRVFVALILTGGHE